MTLLGALILLFGFVFSIKYSGVIKNARKALSVSRLSMAVLHSSDKRSDEEKEVILQGYAKQLFILFIYILSGSFISLLLPAVLVWVLDWFGFLEFDSVVMLTLSWQFILGSVVLIAVIGWSAKRV